MIEPWKRSGSKPLADFRLFTIRADAKQSPRTGQTHDFYVIDTVNWVNVVAVTPQNELVMVEQYRHGSDTVELELPGGMMDPEDVSPVAAGLRELREETGYEGDGARARIIGAFYPNPALMSNTCYTVLVENCRLAGQIKLDQTEDVLTRLAPAGEVAAMVSSGQIRHSLVVAALYYFELARRR
jgi:8-oxo-dGTP pyrophosphatase MutT (NUDIX family)